jgi:hypothetical protein
MKNKEETLDYLIGTDEGRQRLAHAMAGSKEPFVYKPRSEEEQMQSYANGLRWLASQQTPDAAALMNRMADGWEEYAKLPRWKRWLFSIFGRFL